MERILREILNTKHFFLYNESFEIGDGANFEVIPYNLHTQ